MEEERAEKPKLVAGQVHESREKLDEKESEHVHHQVIMEMRHLSETIRACAVNKAIKRYFAIVVYIQTPLIRC